MRRAEMARRRRNLSEKRNEEVKVRGSRYFLFSPPLLLSAQAGKLSRQKPVRHRLTLATILTCPYPFLPLIFPFLVRLYFPTYHHDIFHHGPLPKRNFFFFFFSLMQFRFFLAGMLTQI